jgi:1,4-dihydroxy-2-naphthoate octaprenyltransferase
VTSVQGWVAGARPRTLPASLVPVVVGTACAAGEGDVIAWRAVAAGVVALGLQIGTNYANDYSDGVRGTDTARVGPVRLVASGLASATSVKRAAMVAFGVAAVSGLALALATSLWLIAVGAVAIAAGWLYTGGPRPYGYLGLGELFVFVFFGLVATAGTTYVQLERITPLAVAAAVAVGFLACALLVANNLRDIPTDAVAGKRTLAVRLGDEGTRLFYAGLIVAAFLVGVGCALSRWGAVACLVAVPFAVAPLRAVANGARGRELIAVLQGTARVQLVFGLAFAAGLWLTA